MKLYPEARQALLEAQAILVPAFGAEHTGNIRIIQSMIEIFTAEGNVAQAEEWRKRLSEKQ